MVNRGKKVVAVTDFLFLGSKITVDGDCSHEIRRHLLLGRKALTNLDSVLKSRHITLPTKVCIVKAMAFPVVVYWSYIWTIKKAECQRIDASKLWCWRRLLRVSWTTRRLNQSILREINPEYSFEGLMLKLKLKLQYFSHLMWKADSLEKTLMLGRIEGKRRRGRQRMKRLDSITDSMDMNLGELWKVLRDKADRHAAVHGVKKSWTHTHKKKSGTQLSDWTITAVVSGYSWIWKRILKDKAWILEMVDGLLKWNLIYLGL